MLKENEIKVGDTHTAILVEDLKRFEDIYTLLEDEPDNGEKEEEAE